MSRCKCGNRLYESEMEDMICKKCVRISMEEYNYLEDHEYAFEGLEEGMTEPTDSNY